MCCKQGNNQKNKHSEQKQVGVNFSQCSNTGKAVEFSEFALKNAAQHSCNGIN